MPPSTYIATTEPLPLLKTPGSLQGVSDHLESRETECNYRALLSVESISTRRYQLGRSCRLTVGPGETALASLSGGREERERSETR